MKADLGEPVCNQAGDRGSIHLDQLVSTNHRSVDLLAGEFATGFYTGSGFAASQGNCQQTAKQQGARELRFKHEVI